MNWIKKAKKDNISGGRADGKNSKDFDQESLEKGKKVELEHTDDPDVAEEIAMDHLEEYDNYYLALEKMEELLEELEEKESK